MCQVLLLFHKCCWIFRCQGMVLNNEIDCSIQFGIVYIYQYYLLYAIYLTKVSDFYREARFEMWEHQCFQLHQSRFGENE